MVKQYVTLLAPLFTSSRQEVKRGWGMLPGFLILFFLMGWSVSWGQTSTQNFGTTSLTPHTSATGSTAVIPAPTSGTTWVRGGAVVPNAPINVVTASNPLGTTGAYVRAVASSSTSVAKFSPWVGYTGGTEFYTSFKVLFGDSSGGSTATSGVWKFYQGAGAMYSDASDFSGAQVFTGLSFTYGAGGALALTYRAAGANSTAGLTQTSFASGTVYTIEIVGNNKSSGTINYTYAGNAQTVAVQKFDLYVNGTLIGNDLAEAQLPANTNIASGTFIGISSASNVANIFVDDAVTYNAVPATIGVAPPTITNLGPALTSLTTTYGTASGTTTFSVSASALTALTGITVTPPVGFEVSLASDFSTTIGTNASPLNVGGSGNTASTPVYVRLASTTAAGSYNGGNIVLSSTGATSVNVPLNATNTVNPLGLTITGISVVDKTFDNTTTATLTGTASLVGVLPADTSNVSLGGTPVATFNNATVGNGKPVSVTGYTISGSAIANYSLTQPSLTGNIISSGLQDQTITFGALSGVTYGVAPYALTGTSDSNLTVSYTSSNDNIATISGSTITITGAGTVTITASQAGDSNYNPATSVPQTLVVAQKELTVSGATASNKIYDADTTTAITGGSLVGVINSDDVSFSGTGNFDDFNVGTSKPVTGNLSLSGAKAGNYFLTQPTLSADITAKELTITGISIANKEYDTNDSATILGTASLFGVEFADAFSVSLDGSPAATFNDPSVANNKPVTVSGYSFSGSSNYYLTQPTGLTANITLRTITIVGLTADNKEYDRTSTATLSGTASLSGVLSGDEANVSLAGSPSANFLTATVGNGKTVSVTGYSLSGSALANYTLGALSLSANITKKDVTISGASVADKNYDGTTTATLSGTLSGVISPDAVTLNNIAAFADANVGTNKPVTSTSTITGADSGNYNLVQPTGLTASIIATPCTTGGNGLVTWDFGTASANAAPSSNTATGVTISNIATGNNLGTVAIPINSTSPSTYSGASASFNIGTAARTGAINTGASGSAYYEFTVTPTSGNITLTGISFGSRSTSTAPQAYTLRSSADNYVSNLATGTLLNNSAWALQTASLSSPTATSSAVTYRLFGHSGVGSPSSGTINWRIDDLKLTIDLPVGAALSSPSTASACTGTSFTYTPTTTLTGSTITWTRAAVAGVSNAAVTTPQTGNVNETLVNTTNAPVAVIYSFKVTGTTCYVTGDVTVTVNPLPIVTASDVSGCSGTPITLVGSPVGGTFSVTDPYVGTSSTTYTYTYTDGNSCTATSAPANITITAQPLWYLDADGDHYYTGAAVPSCTSPGAGYTTSVLGGGDCNDSDNTIYPGAAEICYNNILENCTGTKSQGCAAVPVNMLSSYNNTTLLSLATAIPAVPYSYPGTSNIKYRFTVTNTTTGASVADIIQTSRFVNIPGSLYSSPGTFTITASAVINDEVVPYAGNTITVFGPTIPKITLAPTSCGATLATLTSTLTASQGQNATGYTFRIRDIGGSVYFTSSSPTRFVNANSFSGFPLSYSTSYLVSVQYSYIDPVTLLSTDSGYGTECTITTPGIPTISMASPTCGSTVAALNAGITATSAANATSYQFRIRLTSNVGGPYTEATPTASRFSSLTGFGALQYNSSYSVSVRYSVGAQWSEYGPECIINTPNLPTTQLVPSQCGQVAATTLTQQLNIVAYPGFPTYKVKLTEVIGEDLGASQEITVPYAYFRLNQFSIAQNGKDYNIEVAIKQGAVFGPYSTVCDVHTPAIAKTVKMPFKAAAYPNPFANNFMLDVKTTSESLVNLKVYDMVGRLIDSRNVSVSDLETTTIGNEYPSGVYNVVVSQEDSVQTVRVVKR